uniref:HMA domain-containing protein n=1 Tax=Ananas comosus var. bracteatus TaxID=296719 RepID=A0A6V7NMA0_ANACO|nr:unnamed protein product [Ananas comosus var. bracteatus]
MKSSQNFNQQQFIRGYEIDLPPLLPCLCRLHTNQFKQMAEKVSTLILKVDLECCRCNRRIKKVLCKLQERENIKSIVYDEKNNTVRVSGTFNPQCLSKKLRRKACKACLVIKDIQIQEDKPPPSPHRSRPSPNRRPRPSPHRSRPSPNRHRRPSLRQSRPSRNRRPRPSPHRNRPSPHRNRPSPHRSRPSQHRNRPSPHRSRPSPNRRQRRRWRCRILIRCGRSAAGSRAPARATTTEEEEEAAGAAPAAGRTADGTPAELRLRWWQCFLVRRRRLQDCLRGRTSVHLHRHVTQLLTCLLTFHHYSISSSSECFNPLPMPMPINIILRSM